MSGSHVPVHTGASSGMTRSAVHADAIHGESGLEGTSLLPIPTFQPLSTPAIDAMASALLATPPGTAWLIATGALTNVAQCLEKYTKLATHLRGLSLMGGAIGSSFSDAVLGKVDDRERIGNWSAWAEFNILVDPEAASFLFSHPVLKTKITMIPLDVTHQVLATPDIQTLLLHGKTGQERSTLRTMLVELLTFFAKTYADVFGITKGPPLHDPLAVAVVLDGIAGVEVPFYDSVGGGRRERFEVGVATEGTHAEALLGAETGRTVVRLLPEGEEGVKIPRRLDVRRFWGLLEECLERADRANAVNSAK